MDGCYLWGVLTDGADLHGFFFIRGISDISGQNKNRLIAFIRVEDLLSTR